MNRIWTTLGKRNRGNPTFRVFALCATTAIALPAQTFTTLHSFDRSDGATPKAALVQGTDGNLYGTTEAGGDNCRDKGCGTIFKISPSGDLTMLHAFCAQTGCPGGGERFDGLIQAADGDFYGTTNTGPVTGSGCFDGCGTIFKITSSGTLTTLYKFCSQSNCADGANPIGGLVQAPSGDFYGTTSFGGNAGVNCTVGAGCGTVFKITPGGALTTLHSFCSLPGCTDGSSPDAGLVRATNGDFYGTTTIGSNSTTGATFREDSSEALISLRTTARPNALAGGTCPNAQLSISHDASRYRTGAVECFCTFSEHISQVLFMDG